MALMNNAGVKNADKVPVVFVSAKNLTEARQLVLAAASEFATLKQKATLDYLKELKWKGWDKELEFTRALKRLEKKVAGKKTKTTRTGETRQRDVVTKELHFNEKQMDEFRVLTRKIQVRTQTRPEEAVFQAIMASLAAEQASGA
jgi:hypothetical protein